jgi:hypothetical protein
MIFWNIQEDPTTLTPIWHPFPKCENFYSKESYILLEIKLNFKNKLKFKLVIKAPRLIPKLVISKTFWYQLWKWHASQLVQIKKKMTNKKLSNKKLDYYLIAIIYAHFKKLKLVNMMKYTCFHYQNYLFLGPNNI